MDKDVKKEIYETLSSNGLEVAEDVATDIVKAAFEIVRMLLPKVSKMWALVLIPMLAQLEPQVLKLIDKIDGIDETTFPA